GGRRSGELGEGGVGGVGGQARFRSLAELSSDWYWEQDGEFRFVDLTNETELRQRIGASAQVGKRRWEVAAPNMTDADWATHLAVLEAHEPFHDFELCRIGADGARIWVSISGEPIFGLAGEFKGYRGVGRAITARKREER